MASVTFSPSVGGDGSTVTDDNNPTTGLKNGGHRDRFVPALSQVVAVAANTVTQATNAASSASTASGHMVTASNWATKTDNFVSGSDNSAKSWAIGGTGSGDPTAGSAKDWAIQLGTTVDGSEYSAKEYAVGTTIPTGSAKEWSTQTGVTVDGSEYSAKEYAVGTFAQSSKQWAVKTSGVVDGSEFSSKEYAVGTNIRGMFGKGSAKDWATYTGGTVDGTEYSAKKYAQDAAILFDQFDDKYLGAKASDPTLDNDGNPLQAGATYVNTTTELVRFYTGSTWVNGISGVAGVSSIDGQVGDLVTKTINGNEILGSGDITIATSNVTLTGLANVYVGQVNNYTITNYSSFSTYSVSVSSGSVSRTNETVTVTSPVTAGSVTLTITADGNSTQFPIAVLPAGVETPVNSTPTNGATDQIGSVTLTASSFQWIGVSDTHLNSDWQVSTDAGFSNVVFSSMADATNKTSWTVTGLSTSQTYYWRVRYRGTNNGVSSYSSAFSFVTKAVFGGLIGTQGGQGFGVGVYPDTLPAGFSNMASNTDPAHANYGNYTTTNGSIMVFVPKFYYRIGNAASPRFATYGANAVDVVGIETYASEALANAAGYALHRAFKDGGAVKHGFFIDKYLASKDGTTTCKSVASAVPISLTTAAGYTASNGMIGCTGILADAVVLSRARGAGVFNVASVFMYSALALLSLAHAQASTSTANCAWYHPTNNFPKGCNNNALADTNDATVTYTTAGDSGNANKPLTRANANFAKTTHNGQESGVADLNGSMLQAALGITNFGMAATDTAVYSNGDVYVLKESVALASLTAGWDGANDAWGNTTSLTNKYDAATGLFSWGSSISGVYFGNGTNQVFSGATSGISYKRTACGVQDTTNGTSATGTDLFGKDYCERNNRANMFVLCSGPWNYGADAGVFYRGWYSIRSSDSATSGFRAAAFGS